VPEQLEEAQPHEAGTDDRDPVANVDGPSSKRLDHAAERLAEAACGVRPAGTTTRSRLSATA
jgi:hypothetical protein